MSVAATGPIALPLANLRTLLAASATFQAWVGAAGNATEAADAIHLVDLPPPTAEQGSYTLEELEELRPFATVDEFTFEDARPGGDSWITERIGLGAFKDGGRLLLTFEAGIAPEDAADVATAKMKLMNKLGAIFQEMRDLAGGDTEYLSVHRITRHHPYTRSDQAQRETQGDFWRVSFRVDWGI